MQASNYVVILSLIAVLGIGITGYQAYAAVGSYNGNAAIYATDITENVFHPYSFNVKPGQTTLHAALIINDNALKDQIDFAVLDPAGYLTYCTPPPVTHSLLHSECEIDGPLIIGTYGIMIQAFSFNGITDHVGYAMVVNTSD